VSFSMQRTAAMSAATEASGSTTRKHADPWQIDSFESSIPVRLQSLSRRMCPVSRMLCFRH
jgi:hypothetical protein